MVAFVSCASSPTGGGGRPSGATDASAAAAPGQSGGDGGGTPDATSGTGTLPPGYPTAPGIYAEVAGSALSGAQQFVSDVSCFQGDLVASMSAQRKDDRLELYSWEPPAKGKKTTRVYFRIDVDGNADNGVYPDQATPGGGTCTMEFDAPLPALRARFSCTGLKATSSGRAFAIERGYVVCP